mmetsp:Transcript_9524/g.16377  ORF Transcript_9524/g.16377 Transcript_9524/m.16377 type:complete len:270 (-) Transcript_9524:211-1020(-)
MELVARLVVFTARPHRRLALGIGNEVTHVMVHQAMVCFICAHHQNYIPKSRIFRHVPIFDGYLRCRDVLDLPGIHHLQHLSVCVHSLLFQVAHEAMCNSGSQHIKKSIRCEENTLSAHHDDSLMPSLVGQLHKSHQVHALILCLVHNWFDPIAMDHATQRAHVVNHTRYKARNGGNSLQHASTIQQPIFEVGVTASTQELHNSQCYSVLPCDRFIMRLIHPVLVQSFQDLPGGPTISRGVAMELMVHSLFWSQFHTTRRWIQLMRILPM